MALSMMNYFFWENDVSEGTNNFMVVKYAFRKRNKKSKN